MSTQLDQWTRYFSIGNGFLALRVMGPPLKLTGFTFGVRDIVAESCPYYLQVTALIGQGKDFLQLGSELILEFSAKAFGLISHEALNLPQWYVSTSQGGLGR